MTSFRPLASASALFGLAVVLGFSSHAEAGIAEWLAAVADGSPAGFTQTNITEPTTADIGTYDAATSGGITYEFIVNASDEGGSSALMGSRNAPVGDNAGLKFEQWQDTGNYGVTTFGVADFDSGIATIFNQDHQVAFVVDGTNTTIYVNGASAGTIADASPVLSGLTGLGQAYDHSDAGTGDPLDGTILGVAAYDSALGADEIAAHYNAFAIPEPSSLLLALAAAAWLPCATRRRR